MHTRVGNRAGECKALPAPFAPYAALAQRAEGGYLWGMKQIMLFLVLALPLSACAGVLQKRVVAAPVAPLQSTLQRMTTGGSTAAALDTTSAAQKAAALAAADGGQVLGIVSVALGSPAEQGLWLKTSFVKAKTAGRVVLPNGKGVSVDLLPGGGAATLSLAAYRALGLGLTDLPQVQVLASK